MKGLVIGIGPVGLMSVAGANLRGTSRIIAVGTRPVCVEAAKFYGALVASGKLDLSPLSTHVFEGWDHAEEALFLMRDKPTDLIKPIVKFED